MSSSWIQPNCVVAWEGKGDGVEHKDRRPVVKFPDAKEIVPSVIAVLRLSAIFFSANELGIHRQRLIGDVGVKVN